MWIETFGAEAVRRADSAARRSAGAACGRRRSPRSPRSAPARSRPAEPAGRCRGRARRPRRARNSACPEGEHGGEPGADDIGGDRQHDRLARRWAGERVRSAATAGCRAGREPGQLPVVRIGRSARSRRTSAGARRRTCPSRGRRRLRWSSTADRGLDDVVVDAEGLGARDEVAQHGGLLDAARIGVLHVVAGARPAEFGDHDALAGMLARSLL